MDQSFMLLDLRALRFTILTLFVLMTCVYRTICLLKCLLITATVCAQSYVNEFIPAANISYSSVHQISKDAWNRLILISDNEMYAYDGQSQYSIIDEQVEGKLLDIRIRKDSLSHFILTSHHVYVGFPRWNLSDSMTSYSPLAGPVSIYYFHENYLFYQGKDNIVHQLDLYSNTDVELPYIGGELKGIHTHHDNLYLISNEAFKWNISSESFKKMNLSIPKGDLKLVRDENKLVLVTETGHLWHVDLELFESNYMDRVSSSSQIIGGEKIDNELYLFSRSHGVIIYNLESEKVSYLHDGKGLCSNQIRAWYMDNRKFIWTTGPQELCLTKNKYPIIADKDLGVPNERMNCLVSWDDKLFFSSRPSGFYQFEHNRIRPITAGEGFLDVEVSALLPLKSDNLLIGTVGSGIIQLSPDGSFHYMDSSALFDQRITHLIELPDKAVLVGTYDHGLWKMDTDSFGVESIERIFPSTIKRVVDIIDVFTGDFLIAEQKNLFYFDQGSRKLTTLYQSENNQHFRDIALWDGWIYTITNNELIRIPMPGTGELTEHFDKNNGLRSNNLSSVHCYDDHIYVSDEFGTIKYPSKYFDNPRKDFNCEQYAFAISGNGISRHQNSLIAATSKGIVDLSIHPDKPSGKLLLHDLTVNDKAIPNLNQTEFRFDENRWLVDYALISPEEPADALFSWTLSGEENSFSGRTDQKRIYFPYLPPDGYELTVEVDGPARNTNSIVKRFIISQPFYSTKGFKLLCVGAGLLFLSLLIYITSRLASQRAERRNKRLQWENEKLEWQQKALQLQMNPHFIFNALNSIQSLVGKDDKQAKYYIAKLGKLMRMTLNHSREKWITINDEIEILSTYLDLEKLNRPFTYLINKHSIEDVVSIPPMMLQPIVENAVKHGVHRIDQDGHISIDFSYEGKKIKCVVADNGPGIDKRNDEDSNHISISTRVINERMELYAQEGVKVGGMKLLDLKDQGGRGTSVQVGLPYIEKLKNE